MRRRKNRRERGAAAVEFAVVLPVFLMLVMGAIDFGYYFFVSEIVTNAAREGARAGSVLDPGALSSDVIEKAETTAEKYIEIGGLKPASVSASTLVVNGAPAVQVDVVYPVGTLGSLTGFFSGIMPDNSVAHAVMRWQ